MKVILILFCSAISLLAGDKFKVGVFEFESEAVWVKAPSSTMVKAAFNYGETGPLLKFYHFGKGQGGGVRANFKRWRGQFSKIDAASESNEKYGNQDVAMLEITGTYLDGPPMSRNKVPKEDYALLGAVVPHPEGDVFLKMTGSKKDVLKAKKDFAALVKSAFAEATK